MRSYFALVVLFTRNGHPSQQEEKGTYPHGSLFLVSTFISCYQFPADSNAILLRTDVILFVLVRLQFVADGVFKAELNSFLSKELAEDGYSGVEVRVTPTRTEIIIRATRTINVLGEKGRRIRELTSVVQKRFSFPEGTVEVGCRYYRTRADLIVSFTVCHPVVCREGGIQGPLCHCSVRVPAVQADWRFGRT